MKNKSLPKSPSPDETNSLEAHHSSTAKSVPQHKTHTEPPQFKRILVPIDFSDASLRAMDYAKLLGEKFGAHLTLLHVVEPAVHTYLQGQGAFDDASQKLIHAAREKLVALSNKAAIHALPIETLVRMGHSFSEIADTAKALGADLIVLGAHGRNATRATLGGTSERVLRQAACPVLTVPYTSAETPVPAH